MSKYVEIIGVKELLDMEVDLRKSADKVDAIIRSYMVDQMNSSQGKRKWAKLADSTLKKKRRTKRPFDTMKRKMWDSFTKKNDPYHDFRSGKNFIISGSKMPDIPGWQMDGTAKIPARSIEVTKDMADEITEVIADEIIRSGS